MPCLIAFSVTKLSIQSILMFFQVQELYLDDIFMEIGHTYGSSYTVDSAEETNLNLVARIVSHLHNSRPIDSGAILVFLTGWDEQDALNDLLVSLWSWSLEALCKEFPKTNLFSTKSLLNPMLPWLEQTKFDIRSGN